MPFDNTPISPPAPELAIVDKMIALLATPDDWCKNRDTAKSAETGRTQTCLAGAFSIAVTGKPSTSVSSLTEREENMLKNLHWLAPLNSASMPNMIYFNDRPETTHADIMAYLNRVRQHYVELAAVMEAI